MEVSPSTGRVLRLCARALLAPRMDGVETRSTHASSAAAGQSTLTSQQRPREATDCDAPSGVDPGRPPPRNRTIRRIVRCSSPPITERGPAFTGPPLIFGKPISLSSISPRGHSEILPAALAMKLRPTRDPCLSRVRYCPRASEIASGENTEFEAALSSRPQRAGKRREPPGSGPRGVPGRNLSARRAPSRTP